MIGYHFRITVSPRIEDTLMQERARWFGFGDVPAEKLRRRYRSLLLEGTLSLVLAQGDLRYNVWGWPLPARDGDDDGFDEDLRIVGPGLFDFDLRAPFGLIHERELDDWPPVRSDALHTDLTLASELWLTRKGLEFSPFDDRASRDENIYLPFDIWAISLELARIAGGNLPYPATIRKEGSQTTREPLAAAPHFDLSTDDDWDPFTLRHRRAEIEVTIGPMTLR